MCGIFASNDPLIGYQHYKKINDRLSFRGPDGQSDLVIKGNWKFYHSRLSIIAPDHRYNQPFRGKNGSTLVFNGEILNFKELIKRFDLPLTISDTEALSYLLELPNFNLDEIEGFFAFAYVDNFGELKYCARDRFGVKPLYIHTRGEYISISSEASLLSDIFDLKYLDDAIEEYPAFRAPVFSESFFCGVSSIEPGTCLINGTYFDALDYIRQDYRPLKEIMAKLEPTICSSIKSRLISDVPVGILYSGGIDSNLIFNLCQKDLTRLTGGIAGDYDLEYARSNKNHKDFKDPIILEVSPEIFLERFEAMIKLRKEPLSVPNEVILSLLADHWSKSNGKVLMSGEAADEFFGGYDRIFSWALSCDNFDPIKFMELYCYVPVSSIPENVKDKVFSFFKMTQHLSPVEAVRYFFVKKHLPVLFRRLDFSLMFSGVEGREPLASKKMFELAMQINPKDLFRNKMGKLPLRLVAEKAFNEEFAFSSKVGFPIDLGYIFKNKPTNDRINNYKIWCEENIKAIK
jgi:asparagine synthase (glutamine-hydrolysing)